MVRHVIRQLFCKNAFTVHCPMDLSLRVECGDYRCRAQREEHGGCPLAQKEGAGRLKSSLAQVKGHKEVIASQSCWGGSDCDGRPLLIGLELITHWPTGTSMAPCSPPPLACAGQPPFAPCSEQASGRGPTDTLSLSTQRHFIQQSFCKNAFTVHRPIGLSLRVQCGGR